MKLDNQILIERYYHQIKDEYPDLSFSQVKEIVSTPFSFLKEQMESDALPTVRLKYFGTFVVYTKRAEHILKRSEQSYLKGNITKKLYEHRKEIITALLEKRKAD